MLQNVPNALEQAIQFHTGGRLHDAEKLYEAILQEAPENCDALHLLGVIRHQQHRDVEAIGLVDAALALDDASAEIHSNRGLILERLGRYEEALQSCSKAITLKPDYGQAYNNRGNILQAMRRFDEAMASYDAAIEHTPDYAEAYNNRGNLLQKHGRLPDAVKSYDRAIALRPNYPEAMNNRGNALQAMGQFGAALASFDRALEKGPSYPEALNNRGNVLQEMKRFEDALRSYEKALELAPTFKEAWNNRGNALQELNRPQDALECYDKAITLHSSYAEAYSNRGNALQRLKRLDDALASYDKAIELRPDYPEAFNNRANLLKDLKRHDEAITNYERAITLKPNYAEAFANRANLLQEMKRPGDAMKSLDQAIALRPDYAEAHNNRGNIYQEAKRFDEALKNYDRAIELKPDFADAYNNRGNALQAQNRYLEALASYDRAIDLKPDFAEAFNNRAISLKELRRFEPSIASYNKAIELRPEYAEAFSNRGNALKEVGRLDEALASYEKARELKPDYIEAFWNRGLLLLTMGDWEPGWEGYEARWRRKQDEGKKPRVSGREWNGEPLEGKKILVYGEQGNGDKIQFIRFIPALKQQGAQVTLVVDERISQLLQTGLEGVTISTKINPRDDFDYNCALMSLPHVFRTRTNNVPNKVPYLKSEDKLRRKWSARIGPRGYKIGIVWQGNAAGAVDNGRSIPLREFAPIARIDGVRLISLQKNHGTDQLANLPTDMRVETLGDDFDSGPNGFLDTAAVMGLMDIVVSSDTAVAHLAGALACPTFLALKFVPDWRWLLDREDTPWYPSMRLFRQTELDSWTSVFDRISKEVRKRQRHKLAEIGIVLPESSAPIVRLSWGELVDKMTVLEIKLECLSSPSALQNVGHELAGLQQYYEQISQGDQRILDLKEKLKAVNRGLWDIEERIRAKETRHSFDDEFITLARSVHLRSDWRARLKREINEISISGIVEERQFIDYSDVGSTLDMSHAVSG